MADLHRNTFAYRWTPDNRLVMGGIGIVNNHNADARMARHYIRRLHRYLPDLPELIPEFAWHGTIAVTSNFLPRIWEVAPGVLAPIACNGRGIALTTSMGKALANYAMTSDSGVLPLDVTPPEPRLVSSILNHGPSIWLVWSSLRDRIDDILSGNKPGRP